MVPQSQAQPSSSSSSSQPDQAIPAQQTMRGTCQSLDPLSYGLFPTAMDPYGGSMGFRPPQPKSTYRPQLQGPKPFKSSSSSTSSPAHEDKLKALRKVVSKDSVSDSEYDAKDTSPKEGRTFADKLRSAVKKLGGSPSK